MVKEVNVRMSPAPNTSLSIQKTECVIVRKENMNEKLNF